MSKKILSLLIAVMMVGTMTTIPAFAVEEPEPVERPEDVYKIVLNGEEVTLTEEETYQIETEVQKNEEPDIETGYVFEYSSDNEDFVTVDNDGLVTAVAETEEAATVTVSAKLEEEIVASTELKVNVEKKEEITVNEISCEDTEVLKGSDVLLKPEVIMSDGEPAEEGEYTFEFVSENEETATVDENGIVSGVTEGDTTVTISLAELPEITKDVEVSVKGLGTGFVISIPENMPEGFSKEDFQGEKVNIYRYDGGNITTDSGIIPEDVTVGDFLSGKAQVWEAYQYNKKAINLNKIKDITITLGDSIDVKKLAIDESAEFAFASGDIECASISDEGVVEALKPGKTTIAVSAGSTDYYSKQTKMVNITVEKKEQVIEAPESFTKYIGEGTVDLASQIDVEGEAKLSYESGNATVAAIDETGTVKIMQNGSTAITVTAAETPDYKPGEAVVNVTVKTPYAPTLTATALKGKDKRKIRLTWTKVPGATKYQIYCYNDKKTKTVSLSSCHDSGSKLYITNTKLKAGKKYKYKVRALSYNPAGKQYTSPYSAIKSATAKRK